MKETGKESIANMDHSVARSNYDRLSRWYDLLEGHWEQKPRKAVLKGLDAFPGCRVLEIGCGTGNSLEDLHEKIAGTGIVVGVDLSTGMLLQARKRLLRKGVASHASLTQADAVRLPFPNEFFDILFISFTLELFSPSEIPVVLAETSRVLKPGGHMGAVSVSRSGGSRWMVRLYEKLHQIFPQVVDCAPIDLSTHLEAAGFSKISRWTFSLFGIGVESVTIGK